MATTETEVEDEGTVLFRNPPKSLLCNTQSLWAVGWIYFCIFISSFSLRGSLFILEFLPPSPVVWKHILFFLWVRLIRQKVNDPLKYIRIWFEWCHYLPIVRFNHPRQCRNGTRDFRFTKKWHDTNHSWHRCDTEKRDVCMRAVFPPSLQRMAIECMQKRKWQVPFSTDKKNATGGKAQSL